MLAEMTVPKFSPSALDVVVTSLVAETQTHQDWDLNMWRQEEGT